jgi:hypothetical protein
MKLEKIIRLHFVATFFVPCIIFGMQNNNNPKSQTSLDTIVKFAGFYSAQSIEPRPKNCLNAKLQEQNKNKSAAVISREMTRDITTCRHNLLEAQNKLLRLLLQECGCKNYAEFCKLRSRKLLSEKFNFFKALLPPTTKEKKIAQELKEKLEQNPIYWLYRDAYKIFEKMVRLHSYKKIVFQDTWQPSSPLDIFEWHGETQPNPKWTDDWDGNVEQDFIKNVTYFRTLLNQLIYYRPFGTYEEPDFITLAYLLQKDFLNRKNFALTSNKNDGIVDFYNKRTEWVNALKKENHIQ